MKAELPSGFRLRPMHAADIPEVHALEESIFPTPWSMNSYTFEVDNNPASDPWVVEAQAGPGELLVAGYIIPWLLMDEVHIANIAVAPPFRRQGLATCMLQHALQRGAQKGARRATLEVRYGNRTAQALYRRAGFKKVGLRKAYYHDNGEDALIMALEPLVPVKHAQPLEVS